MTFLITLVALLIERFFDWGHVRQWGWFPRLQQWMGARFPKWPAYLLLLATVLPVMLIAYVVGVVLDGALFGVAKFLYSVLLLMYCIGPKNIWAQTYACIGAPDAVQMTQLAQTSFAISANDDSQAFHQTLTRALFVAANHRLFAVLFWFIFLGPIGAVFYRLMVLSSAPDATGQRYAIKILGLLNWLPARLITFFFALGGHFTQVMTIWKNGFLKGILSSDVLVEDGGMAALDVTHTKEAITIEKQALALLDRTFVIGLVILAIFVLLL